MQQDPTPAQGAGRTSVFYVLANPAHLDPSKGLYAWISCVEHGVLSLAALGLLAAVTHYGGKINRERLTGGHHITSELAEAVEEVTQHPHWLIREMTEVVSG